MNISRRNFLETAAGAGAYAALSPHFAKGQEGNWQPGLIWPPDQALPHFLPPDYLDAAAIESLTGDEQILLVTLQGVVNRRQTRIYLRQNGDGTDGTWLDTLQTMFHIQTNLASDPLSLIYKYRQEVRGAIIYDPLVSHTINVATSLAGLMDAVVTSADVAAQYGLPIVMDLRGRFTGKLQAYNWLIDNYWPQLTHRLLVGINPANISAAPGVEWTAVLEQTTQVHNSSNKGTYNVDLTSFLGTQSVYVRFQDSFQNQGFGPSVQQVTVLADGNVIASFQPTTADEDPFLYEEDNSAVASGGWRFADATAYFIYRFTPPAGTKTLTVQVLMWNQFLITATNQPPLVYSPNARMRDYIAGTQALVFWLDPEVPGAEAQLFAEILQKTGPNTPYLGWYVDGREVPGTTLLSENASLVIAADLLNNATVMSAVPAPIRAFQPPAPVPELKNKIYVTITMSEGDNMQYCEHRLRQIWDDPNRGQLPINWSISPFMLDIGTPMLHYYQSTQSPNDFLVAGPSGAGYTYPAAWPAADFPAYVQRTGQYMERQGLNVIFALNHPNGAVTNLTDSLAAEYKQYVRGLLGIFFDWTSTSNLTTPDGLPVISDVQITSASQGLTELTNAANNWSGDIPLFVSISAIAWDLTPTTVNQLIASLGSQFEVVRGDVFFKLLQQTLGSS